MRVPRIAAAGVQSDATVEIAKRSRSSRVCAISRGALVTGERSLTCAERDVQMTMTCAPDLLPRPAFSRHESTRIYRPTNDRTYSSSLLRGPSNRARLAIKPTRRVKVPAKDQPFSGLPLSYWPKSSGPVELPGPHSTQIPHSGLRANEALFESSRAFPPLRRRFTTQLSIQLLRRFRKRMRSTAQVATNQSRESLWWSSAVSVT